MPFSSLDSPRLRFWEIEDFFQCPAIGWCLDIAEQREILRKERICIKDNPDFKSHALAVESIEDENTLSRKLYRRLNRKYKKEVKKFSCLAQEEFIGQWEASLDRGVLSHIKRPDFLYRVRDDVSAAHVFPLH